MQLRIPVSAGELADKLSILFIKSRKIPEHEEKIRKEIDLLFREFAKIQCPTDKFNNLESVNVALWEVEDQIRILDKQENFGPAFVELAKSVYRLNGKRCKIKKEIDILNNSELTEFKKYTIDP